MDICRISFTESGNEATVFTDAGIFDISRADFNCFFAKIIGGSPISIKNKDFSDYLPLYADDAELKELEALAEKLRAIKYAAYLLGINDKSEKILRSKLKLKGYSGNAADAAVEVLKKNGYLSDERFCRRRCEILAQSKLFGRRRIISELMAKGLAYDLCDRIIDDAEIDFEENLKLLFDKLTKGNIPKDREQKKKISDKLLRYGYSYGEISELFNSLDFDDEA